MLFYYSLLVIFLVQFEHDFHFALTEIYFNEKNKSLEVSIKVFANDLEDAISEGIPYELKLNSEDEHEKSDYYIGQYLYKNVQFDVNNKEKEYEFLGKEYEDDAVWMYIEVKQVKKIKSLTIKNSLLHDLFDDQINIITADINGQKKGEPLEKSSPQITFEYK